MSSANRSALHSLDCYQSACMLSRWPHTIDPCALSLRYITVQQPQPLEPLATWPRSSCETFHSTKVSMFTHLGSCCGRLVGQYVREDMPSRTHSHILLRLVRKSAFSLPYLFGSLLPTFSHNPYKKWQSNRDPVFQPCSIAIPGSIFQIISFLEILTAGSVFFICVRIL